MLAGIFLISRPSWNKLWTWLSKFSTRCQNTELRFKPCLYLCHVRQIKNTMGSSAVYAPWSKLTQQLGGHQCTTRRPEPLQRDALKVSHLTVELVSPWYYSKTATSQSHKVIVIHTQHFFEFLVVKVNTADVRGYSNQHLPSCLLFIAINTF